MLTERDIIIDTINAGIEAACFLMFLAVVAAFWVGTP